MDIKATSFDEVNTILTRLLRRSSKNITGLLSPVLIHMDGSVLGEDGILGQRLFHIPGILTDIGVYLPGVTKDNKPSLSVEFLEPSGLTSHKDVIASKTYIEGQLNVSVIAGTVLTVRISDPTQKDILVAATFVPQLGKFNALKYLHDTMESTADEGI